MAELYSYLSEKYKPETPEDSERRLLELSSLFEISQLLNSSLNLNHILNNILLIPMGRLMITRGFIFLKRNDLFEITTSKGLPKNSPTNFPAQSLSEDYLRIDEYIEQKPAEIPEIISFAHQHRLKIFIPFVSQNNFMGGVIFGSKLNQEPFTPEEINFLLSLVSIATTSIENALHLEKIQEINLELDHKIQELKTLFDIAQGLSSTLDTDQVLKLLTYALMGQMLITQYAIVIKKNGFYKIHDQKQFNRELLNNSLEQIIKLESITEPTETEKLKDPELLQILQNTGASLIIPMRHQNRLIGFLLLGKKMSQTGYSGTDIEFLTTLVNQAIISMENARLFKETLEKQRLEDELNVARKIQARLLPTEFPKFPNYELFGINISSKQVGGDYFDIIAVDKQKVFLAIADVSGKGVPASLLMANLQSALRILIAENLPLDQIVTKLNNLIFENTEADKFITFFAGCLHVDENTFEYVNAGHNSPLFLNGNGELKLLDVGGIILGILPDYPFQSETIEFGMEDLLLCYTDGVNEALNPEDEEFSEERIIQLVKRFHNEKPKEICEKIIKSISEFTRFMPQGDDITLLAAKRIL